MKYHCFFSVIIRWVLFFLAEDYLFWKDNIRFHLSLLFELVTDLHPFNVFNRNSLSGRTLIMLLRRTNLRRVWSKILFLLRLNDIQFLDKHHIFLFVIVKRLLKYFFILFVLSSRYYLNILKLVRVSRGFLTIIKVIFKNITLFFIVFWDLLLIKIVKFISKIFEF